MNYHRLKKQGALFVDSSVGPHVSSQKLDFLLLLRRDERREGHRRHHHPSKHSPSCSLEPDGAWPAHYFARSTMINYQLLVSMSENIEAVRF